MPGPSSAIPSGNVESVFALRVTVNTAVLPAGPATTERTFTVPGLLPSDYVGVVKPTFQNNVAIGGARVSAANTLAINFISFAAVTPTVEDYFLTVIRSTYDNPAVQLPTAIA